MIKKYSLSGFVKNLLLLTIAFISSCINENGYLPSSSGKTAEILFIIDKYQWDGIAGDSIKAVFRSEYRVLNQPEPMFNLANIEEKSFTKIFESHRNIFIVEIKPEFESTKFEVRKNVWAQPQLVVRISAKSAEDFIAKLSLQKEQIVRLFFENERERMLKAFKHDEDVTIGKQLRDKYGLSLTIPNGYFIAKSVDNFCWIRRETEETSMGVLIYTQPYLDTAVFQPENIIALRDSMTQLHVPGPSDGSYMQVSQKLILPIHKEINFKDSYAVETRGLWDVEGDFMGGPFINYTFVDEERNRVITLDAFVYAPRYNKRDYILQCEALLYSVELSSQVGK
ncbi:MAG: DUF4837 family protein [Bacteroidales bacterium]|nr:DUF4837 family protein [Bacteroidales bacterium]